jgi:hypothetical protein
MEIKYGGSYKYLWGYWAIACVIAFVLVVITKIILIFVLIPCGFMYYVAYSQYKSGVALDGMAIGKFRRVEEPIRFWINTAWIFLLATTFITYVITMLILGM